MGGVESGLGRGRRGCIVLNHSPLGSRVHSKEGEYMYSSRFPHLIVISNIPFSHALNTPDLIERMNTPKDSTASVIAGTLYASFKSERDATSVPCLQLSILIENYCGRKVSYEQLLMWATLFVLGVEYVRYLGVIPA